MKGWRRLLAGWWSGARGAHSRARKVYLIDVTSVVGRQERGVLAPRETLRWIDRLAQLAEGEQVRLRALFVGEPLRKAPDGSTRGELEIHYARPNRAFTEEVAHHVRSLRRRGFAVTVVSSNPDVERIAVNLHCPLLHASSFRKLLEQGAKTPASGSSAIRTGTERRGRRQTKRGASERGEADTRVTDDESANQPSSEAGPEAGETEPRPQESDRDRTRIGDDGEDTIRKYVDVVE